MIFSIIKKIRFEYKITFTYLIIGFLWIVFSDKLLDYLISDNQILTKFQTFKGSFYVIITSLLLYCLVRRHIKKLKKSNETLIESNFKSDETEAQFRLLIENAPIGIVIQTNHKFAYLNNAALNLYGAERDEQLLGADILERIHPDYRDIVSKRISAVNNEFNKVHDRETIHLKLDNTPFNVDVMVVPFRFRNENGALVFVRDITDIKKAENEIKQKNIFIQTVLDNLPIGISLNKINEGTATYINKKFIEIYGWPADEFTDTSTFFQKVYPDEEYRNEIISKVMNDINSGIPENMHWEKIFITQKNGNNRIINAVNIPLTEQNTMISTVLDMTDLYNIQKDLINAKEKAEESDRLKSAFLQNISHEVRTPLNSIVGFSQLITEPNRSPEKLKTYSKYISANSKKLIEIINDIIEISLIHTNQITTKLNEAELISFITSIVDDFKEKAKAKEIELLLNMYIPDNKIIIISDIEKLNKILIHLIENAIKFTKQGSVQITCEIKQENFFFSISDTGIGIPEEKQNIIFEPFRQIDIEINKKFEGNGLGLSIAKAYIELLNGTISLKSEVNKGTTFNVLIPLNNSNFQIEPKASEKQNYLINTILIAEDEYYNYQYLLELLDETKINILYAENGQKALDLCKINKDIDLVLMDIRMPIMNGHIATKLIKEFRPELPIIAQTAYALESDKSKFLNDFDDYISKPISKDELRQKLKKYIDII